MMSADTSVDIVWEPPTQLSSLDCWDYSIELDCLRGPEDLQLAAELGKTLLERNKELENCIKLHQGTIDDQAQEIEYMKKQTAALREVNDSRLKIYEQLEVSIQDLERANQRLALENANDKKQIKSQCLTIDTLEARVDELQKKYEQVNTRYETLLREQTKSSDIISNVRTAPLRDGSTQNTAVSPRRTSPDDESNSIHQLATAMANDEDVTRLLQQLQEARSQRAREQKRVGELKEQLDAVLHEHAQMEEQLNLWKSKAQDIKNLQDEINTLEEVRQGHLCGRCLRGTDSRTQDELSVMFDGEEDDEISLAESLADSLRDADSTLQELTSKTGLSEESSCNIYRELVEKYEALLKVQQNTSLRRKAAAIANPPVAMSLQEELQMSGEFNAFNSTQSEIESNHENGRASVASVNHRREGSIRAKNKPFACTPTDFSEAETSSSGFADETSNKATQTEGRPGSFLCSIADGDDCKFSIYDDSSSLESHFHKTPEYRKLFSEIFEVLKRAAVAKAEGTELPLLDDSSSELLTPKNEQCPPFPCFTDEAPSEATDDARSIVSLAVSSVVSEPVFRVHTPVLSRKDDGRHGKRDSSHHQSMMSQQHHHHHHQQQQQQHNNNNTTPESQKTSSDAILRPIHNRRYQQLEYISVQARKKPAKKSKRLNSSSSSINGDSCPATPDVVPTPNPRVTQLKGSGRRKFRPLTTTEISDGFDWNGATAHFYPSKSPRGRHHQSSSFSRDNFANAGQDYKPGTASEEVAKLRRLEMSYAEALRMPNKSKVSSSRHRKNH